MKIGLVLSNTPVYSETFITNKIKGLQNFGHEVIIFGRMIGNFKFCEVVEPPRIDKKRFISTLIKAIYIFLRLFIFKPKSIIKFLIEEKKDGKTLIRAMKNLYFNNQYFFRKLDWIHFCYATLTIGRENIAGVIGARMGVSFRGFDICLHPLKNPNCYKNIWGKIDKVHSISSDLLNKAEKYGFTYDINHQIINPGIDTNIFHSDKDRIKKYKSYKKIRLLSVSRLHWKKGLEYTIEALAILKRKGFSCDYHIIGDGKEKERLLFAAHQLGLAEDVHFIGELERHDIIKYYKDAHIYIQYSIQEGFCNAVLESQSMGLLTIASDAEGLQENIISEKTGWIIPKRNPQNLSKKIMEVVNLSLDEKMAISNRAVQRVRKHFALNNQQKLMNEFFTQL